MLEHAHARAFMTMSGKVGARSRARKRRTHRQTHTHRGNGACTRARGGGRRERDERWRGAADGGARAADDGAGAVADGARAVASFVVDGDHPPLHPSRRCLYRHIKLFSIRERGLKWRRATAPGVPPKSHDCARKIYSIFSPLGAWGPSAEHHPLPVIT